MSTTVAKADLDGAYVVFGKPDIQQAEIDEVTASLASGWLGTGPKVKAFEAAVAEYVESSHAVASNSCTASLHVALLALGVGPGDEVIVPSMTFCATANVVMHTGATPILVDVERDSQCVSPELVEAAITPRTKALLPVHFAGWPAPMAELRALADRRGLRIVQDAAHCIEGRIAGRHPAHFGDITCFSFYSTKNVVTGEGGMAVTGDEDLARRMRVMGLHGLSADAWQRFTSAGYRHYDCVLPGFKYNMMDLQAAIGLHQLHRVEPALAIRERQWARYNEMLADLPLDLPAEPLTGLRHARHLYTIQARPEAALDRDGLLQALHARGIGAGVHYRPVHSHSFYREQFHIEDRDLPVATSIGQRTLSIPLGPGLRDDEQERVITVLHEVLAG